MSLTQRYTNVVPETTTLLGSNQSISSSDYSDKKYARHEKPLILFSTIDISSYSKATKYIILLGGLVFFMCGYGYYQELVIYGWFQRKLSLFSTFIHFLGCTAIAQLQRNTTKKNLSYSSNFDTLISSTTSSLSSSSTSSSSNTSNMQQDLKNPNEKAWWKISMGVAPFSVSLYYYVSLVLLKYIAQVFSNLSMTEITYPVKVLFKSMNPIITIVVGTVFLRKRYKFLDYLVVFLLVLGLVIFTTDHEKKSNSESSLLGIFYVLLSVIGSASGPMIQERAIQLYHASVEDLLYFSFLGSTFISFLCAVITGEMAEGLHFVLSAFQKTILNEDNHSIFYLFYQVTHTIIIFFAFTTFAYCGALFSTAITQQYGALINGIANTFRKMITLLLSFFLFPDRNHLTFTKSVGCAIFFLGLIIKTLMKSEKKKYSGDNYYEDDVELGNVNNSSIANTYQNISNQNISVNTSSNNISFQNFMGFFTNTYKKLPFSYQKSSSNQLSSTTSTLYNRFSNKIDPNNDPLLDNLFTIETNIEE